MHTSPVSIEDVIKRIDYVELLDDIQIDGRGYKRFKLRFSFEPLSEPINFDVEITPAYPFKISESESISFTNKDLVEYSHVMGSGSICFHNVHETNYEKKLIQDISAIRNWISKYVCSEETDLHYEHFIKTEACINDTYFSYMFTQTAKPFVPKELGIVKILCLTPSQYKQKNTNNYLVQTFIGADYQKHKCQWSEVYLALQNTNLGIYYFLENAPALNSRFLYQNWQDFSDLISQDFLSYIWRFCLEQRDIYKDKLLPVFFGYRTIEDDVHWQVALIDIHDLFFKNGNMKVDEPNVYKLKNKEIDWAITQDASYKYFFGRGAFSEKLTTNKKILIIGIGAIGSMVAKTLVRGGCQNLTITDYDQKYPENVCRSEYNFSSGVSDKVYELCSVLQQISPFLDVYSIPDFLTKFGLKIDSKVEEFNNQCKKSLNQYDYIFDCSTDNDLMYLLDNLGINSKIINLSISNHATSLVCGVSPSVYRFVRHQFDNIIENDLDDLYNPTGCWSPTFKASYNDISTLVQFALKHINKKLEQDEELQSFIIEYKDTSGMSLQVSEF